MRKLLQEFKDFALRGNVVDMAVGVIIGGAFSPIVTSLVNDIVMPPLGLLIGGMDFKDLAITIKQASEGVDAVTINYGNFIQIVINFLLVALCIFAVVKLINQLRNLSKKKEEVPAEPAAPAEPEPTKEEILLSEIRDILKNK